jgi:hypothetical protein
MQAIMREGTSATASHVCMIRCCYLRGGPPTHRNCTRTMSPHSSVTKSRPSASVVRKNSPWCTRPRRHAESPTRWGHARNSAAGRAPGCMSTTRTRSGQGKERIVGGDGEGVGLEVIMEKDDRLLGGVVCGCVGAGGMEDVRRERRRARVCLESGSGAEPGHSNLSPTPMDCTPGSGSQTGANRSRRALNRLSLALSGAHTAWYRSAAATSRLSPPLPRLLLPACAREV